MFSLFLQNIFTRLKHCSQCCSVSTISAEFICSLERLQSVLQCFHYSYRIHLLAWKTSVSVVVFSLFCRINLHACKIAVSVAVFPLFLQNSFTRLKDCNTAKWRLLEVVCWRFKTIYNFNIKRWQSKSTRCLVQPSFVVEWLAVKNQC